MDMIVEDVGGVAVVTLTEENLDARNAKEFKKAIAPMLQENTRLILDLSHLLFVDSSGLGAILSVLRTLNAQGGDLKLCGMTKQVRVLFELVRMHRIFEIFGTVDEALLTYSVGQVQSAN